MGGCRCIFRDCPVSTSRNPGMHFFHFPVKDTVRFMQWVRMAGAEQILQLPANQQKNRVVCARHFRDECFMNYKKDRLMAKAVPTLLRLSAAVALDFVDISAEGQPQLIKLAKPTKPHLLPPVEFVCPFDLYDDDPSLSVEVLQQKYQPTCDTFAPSLLVPPSDSVSSRRSMSCATKSPTKRLKTAHDVVPSDAASSTLSTPSNAANSPNTIDYTELPDNATTFISNDEMVFYEINDIDEEEEAYDDNADFRKNDAHDEEAADEDEDDDDATTMADEHKYANIIQRVQSDSEQPQQRRQLNQTAKQQRRDIQQKLAHDENAGEETTIETEEELYRRLNDELQRQLEDEISSHAATTKSFSAQVNQLEDTLQNANQQTQAINEKYKQSESDNQVLRARITQLEREHEEIRSQRGKLQETTKDLEAKCETLQAEHTKTQQRLKKLLLEQQQKQQHQQKPQQQQQQVESTTKDTGTTIATIAQSSLTKAQLFNGIKKYLSASMVALVRMEMFGNAEREWKPDERRAAVDLLRLGESVYSYLSDEWRFRLPGLRDVRTWLVERVAADDEEDL